MALSILNNIAALYAENNLTSTSASLQNTLQQLSSGSRINSGADDAAGLAVANGLGANEAALTQSAQNATSGIGLLQTADGALSQVTNLLDRAVTLATESANGTLTGGQVSSANQEYQNILSQIGNIGSTTNFNSSDVFTAQATNIVVTDGTTSGLNTYGDIVGTLTTASVGTSAGSAPIPTTLTATNIVTTQANTGSARVAGTYTLTPANASDTVSGQLSFTVGNTNAQEVDVNVAAGTTLNALSTQLNTTGSAFKLAGMTANVVGGALVISGPTTGANIAANSVSFTNTALTDTLTPPAVTNTGSTAGALGTAATGQLTVAGAVSGDLVSGNIVLTQGSSTFTVNIASGVYGSAGTAGTVENQIQIALAAQTTTHFAVATEGGAAGVNPVLNFTGDNNSTAGGVVITGALTDATTTSGVTYTPAGTAGTNPTPATYSLSALSTGTDTFGTGSTLTINGEAVHLDGKTAALAAAAIGADTVLSGLGITASAASGHIVISGNADGTAIGAVTTLATLTDISSVVKPNLTSASVASIAPQGSTAVAASNTVISMLASGDTLGGTLSITVGSGSTQKLASVLINNGTTGAALATQITQDKSFVAAGVSAVYSVPNNTITLTGPGGASAPQITVNPSTSITESTVSTPGVGANFTTIGVSQLTALTAAAVLTTVTAAVADVAYQRGTLGADINQLTSASNVASSESVNLTSAQQSITATDYGQAASNLSKYQILSQTGISALAQANSVQQEVLKLLQ